MRKLILKNFQSPGDIVMLTAALRDLHKCYPNQFLTDVRTSCPALWEHNPHITKLDEKAKDVQVIDCHYPIIHRSNQTPVHFLHGFIEHLNEKLGLHVKPTAFKGDIHLSPEEMAAPSQIHELVGEDVPFWVIVAGGKKDYTIKWWSPERFQEVVDYFAGRILFVQVGEKGHLHPGLRGVIDLRGQTSLRQLVRLVYHAQGVLCPVTLAMHLAAAVPVKPNGPVRDAKASKTIGHSSFGTRHSQFMRPCVVIAGGREPAHWEAYPGHQFLHTIGALPCCANGGCWKSRTVPLGDGDKKDQRGSLCQDVVNGLPHCMDLIKPDDVIRAIKLYFDGGVCDYFQYELPEEVPHGSAANLCLASSPTVQSVTSITGARANPALITPATEQKVNGTMLERAFAVACDGNYFPGLRTLTNSIWAYHQNQIPIFLYHRGLNAEQMEEMRTHPAGVRLHRVEELAFPSPGMWEAKQQIFAHCIGQARCVYLLDADLVITSEMTDVFELAQSGKIVSSADGSGVGYDISYTVYSSHLPGTRQPYINSGALCLDVLRHWDLVGLWAFASKYGTYSPGGGAPLRLPGHGDQGVFNAIAGALRKPATFHVLPEATWCESTKANPVQIREIQPQGRLEVWNIRENARQRLLHSSGPKWWTMQGQALLARQGDKLKCFQHFAKCPWLVPSLSVTDRTPSKKVVAFSLWGSSAVYHAGAMRNAELAYDHYPGWECWFYCARDVRDTTLAALRKFSNSKVIVMDEDGSSRGLFWRFFPASDPTVEVMLSRDCDSRIEFREVKAVRDFLRSTKRFHVMRDHPCHDIPILAGMFGVKRPLLAEIKDLVERAPEYEGTNARHGSDQDFLGRVVWPIVRQDALVHDSADLSTPWPLPQTGLRFVGQQFDQNDRPRNPKHHEVLPKRSTPTFRLDLREVPLFVVSGARFKERQEAMRRWAAEAGMQRPIFFQDEFGGKLRSNCQNHLSALVSAPVPFLILEDDARPTGRFRTHLEIPCGVSALYLGTSTYGLTPAGPANGVVQAKGTASMPQIFNMLSLHAVCYLDESYVASARGLLLEGVLHRNSPPSDVLVARQMPHWNVRVVNPPLFYQNDGVNERWTQQPLNIRIGE